MIRMQEWIGPHKVCWMQDVSEHVEELTREWVKKYSRMLPTEEPILFAWGEEVGPGAVSMHRLEAEDGCYFAFHLHDAWWISSLEERESDFVMAFLVGGLIESGDLYMSDGGMRLEAGGRILDGEAASEHMNRMADRIFAGGL